MKPSWGWALLLLVSACAPQARLNPSLPPVAWQLPWEQEQALASGKGIAFTELAPPSEEIYALMTQGGFTPHLAWSRPGFVATPEMVNDLRHQVRQGMRFFYAQLQGTWPPETRQGELEQVLGCRLLGDRALRFYLAGNSDLPFAGQQADLLLLGLAEGMLIQGAIPVAPQAFNREIAQAQGLTAAKLPWEWNLLTGGQTGFLLCRAESANLGTAE